MSLLSNELHNSNDVLEKVGKSYETKRIADELVVLDKIYSDDSELNMNKRQMIWKYWCCFYWIS